MATLTDDPFSNLVFTSPSGNGVKLVVAIDNLTDSNFKSVAIALLHFIDNKHSITTDKACTDLSRACYLCYDPKAFLNDSPASYDANQLLEYYKPFKTPVSTQTPLTRNSNDNMVKVQTILKQCKSTGKSLTPTYDEWFKIGAALSSEFDVDTARELFHEFSSLDSTYSISSVDSKFDDIVKNVKPNNKIGIGSLYHIAKNSGITIPKALATKQGNRAMIKQALEERYSFYLDTDTNSIYRATVGNNNPTLYEKIEEKSAVLNAMLSELEAYDINTNKGTVWESIYNPHTYTEISLLQETLDHIGNQWDGNDHFKTLMNSIDVVDKTLFEKQFAKWCVALIAQAYGKGRNDYAMILVGSQGTGKTSFFEQLLFDSKYTVNSTGFDPVNKNHEILMNTKLLIILDEMATYSKADLNQLKSALTKDKITVDRKFQNEQDYKRNATFCGTSNNGELLKDATGDRRYLVFELIKQVDFRLFNSIDKTQLWAQLITLFNNGFDCTLNKQEIEDNINRNKVNFTMQTQEDFFISDSIDITGDPNDYVFSQALNTEINIYIKYQGGMTNKINSTTVREKIKQASITYTVKWNPSTQKSDRAFTGVKIKQTF